MRYRTLTHIWTVLALLFVSAAANAQANAGTRNADGRILTKVIVTMNEPGAFGRPASGLTFLFVAEDGDRIASKTNEAGVASVWLQPGDYRLVTPDPLQWEGYAYTWDRTISVTTRSALFQLTQNEARSISDGVASTKPSRTAEPAGLSSTPTPWKSNETTEDKRAVVAEKVVTTKRTPQNVAAVTEPRSAPLAIATGSNSVTQGFFFAPHLLGASIQVDEDGYTSDVESGGGLGLTLGYGVTRVVSAFFAMDVARIDIVDPDIAGTYTLANADLGIKFNFRDAKAKAIPYVEASFSGRAAQATIEGVDFQISGPAYTFGGGLNYHFQPRTALDVGLVYTIGKFDTVKIDGDKTPIEDLNANGARFRLGFTFYPFSK